MKTNIDPFLKALLLLITFCAVAAFFKPSHKNTYRKITKMKSHLKQIGTCVAMYHADTDDPKYPVNPSVYEIEENLIDTKETSNWLEISLNSPYLFLPNEGEAYTAAADIPLAINWEPFDIPPYYQVIWEDGHVSSLSKEKAQALMNSTLKNRITSIIYKLTYKRNEALK